MMKVARKWFMLLLFVVIVLQIPSAVLAGANANTGDTAAETIVAASTEYDEQLIIMAPYFSNTYRKEYKNENLLEGLSLPLYMLGSEELPVSIFPLDDAASGFNQQKHFVGVEGHKEAVAAISQLNIQTNLESDVIEQLKADTVSEVKALLGYPAAFSSSETGETSVSSAPFTAKHSTVLFFSTMRLEESQSELLKKMSIDPAVDVFHIVLSNSYENNLDNVWKLLDTSRPNRLEAGKIYEPVPGYHAVFLKNQESANQFFTQLLDYLKDHLDIQSTRFIPMKGSEYERYMTLHGSATQSVRLYLSNLSESDTVLFTDEQNAPVSARLLYYGDGTAAYEIAGSHGNRIHVTLQNPERMNEQSDTSAAVVNTEETVPEEFAVKAYYNYIMDDDYISVTLNRGNADNNHIKNSEIEYTITFGTSASSSTQFSQFIKDINAFDNTNCTISWFDTEGNEIVINTKKNFDEVYDTVFYTTSIVLDKAGTFALTPHLEIGNRTFTGTPLEVTVVNRVPIIETTSDVQNCWFDNPWEPVVELELPLVAKDDDNDLLNYALLDEAGNTTKTLFKTGIGKLNISRDGTVVVELDESAAMHLEPVTFQVQVTEHEDSNSFSSSEMAFRLLSMKDCLKLIELTPVQIEPDVPQKREKLTISTSASYDKLDSLVPVEDVKKVFEEKAVLTVQAYENVSGSPLSPVGDPFILTKVDGENHYTGTYTLGDTSIDLVFIVEVTYQLPDGVPQDILPSFSKESDSLHVKNAVPVLNSSDPIPTIEAMLVDEDRTGERWSTSIDLSTLYGDVEDDPLEYRVQISSNNTPCLFEQSDALISLLPVSKSETPVENEAALTEYIMSEAKSLEFVFCSKGSYEIVISARDNESDWQAGYHQKLVLGSTNEELTKTYIFVGLCVLLAVILILILIYCLKKSYDKRVLHVYLSYHSWTQENAIPLTAWKKKKVPFHWILSCAAFPPDEMIFDACSKVFLSPAGKGVYLTDKFGLNLSAESVKNKKDRYLLRDGESMEIRFPKQEDASWDGVVITLSLEA